MTSNNETGDSKKVNGNKDVVLFEQKIKSLEDKIKFLDDAGIDTSLLKKNLNNSKELLAQLKRSLKININGKGKVNEQ
jgi:hypothetical protein